MQEIRADNAFWHYALALYQKPGLACQLLDLQDQHRININLLLLMAWLGSRGQPVDKVFIERCRQQLRAMDDNVMLPLRRARRNLRQLDGAGELYRQALQLELALEKNSIADLYRLAECYAQAKQARDCSHENIHLYVQLCADPALENQQLQGLLESI